MQKRFPSFLSGSVFDHMDYYRHARNRRKWGFKRGYESNGIRAEMMKNHWKRPKKVFGSCLGARGRWFENSHSDHSEMTFGCQVTAQARPPRQQRSFFVQNRNRFAGLRFCFPDLTSYTLVSGKAEPAEIERFQRVFYVNCLSFAKRYSLIIAAQDLRCGFDKTESALITLQ